MKAEIDHFAICTKDVAQASKVFQEVFGAQPITQLDSPEFGTRVAVFLWAGKEVSLQQPIRDDSPYAKYLERRGEGLHHIGIEVDDVEAVVADLEAKGVAISGKHFTGDFREAIVHPKDFFGVLLQIVEWRGECKDSMDARMRLIAGMQAGNKRS